MLKFLRLSINKQQVVFFRFDPICFQTADLPFDLGKVALKAIVLVHVLQRKKHFLRDNLGCRAFLSTKNLSKELKGEL